MERRGETILNFCNIIHCSHIPSIIGECGAAQGTGMLWKETWGTWVGPACGACGTPVVVARGQLLLVCKC